MTPAELPLRLRVLASKARAEAAPAAANAMAFTYQREVVKSMHGPAPSPKGTPPARRSGTLARSVRTEPARGSGLTAKASVAPHTVYARIQQLGGPIDAKRHPVLGNPKVGWFGKHVDLPPRPYMVMTRARRAAVRKAAIEAVKRVIAGG